MEIINYSDMENMIDTLLALAITLEGIAGDNYELNKLNYDMSEAWEQLTDDKITLIKYLENEYQQGHYKSPLIKRLECALYAAEDMISAALKDESKDVYNDWKAVAGLCREWASTISEYYRYNPEPGSIAHAYLANLKRLEGRDTTAPAPTKARQRAETRQTAAAKRLQSQELQEIKSRLIQAGIIKDGEWTGGPAEFERLVKELGKNKDDGGFGIQTNKGHLARKECARFFGFAGNLESARSSTHNDQQTPRANEIKAICREIYTKYVK